MRRILSERNIAATLFVLVLIVFVIAQSETNKMGIKTPGIGKSVIPASSSNLTQQLPAKPVTGTVSLPAVQ